MKRLLDEADSSLGALRDLVQSANRHESTPFAKRAMESRIRAALTAGGDGGRRPFLRAGLLGAGALLVAATAAAAGYSYLAPEMQGMPVAPPTTAVLPPPRPAPELARPAAAVAPAPVAEPQPAAPPSMARAPEKRAGEDPSQVAEAVRVLRKQGDPGRAQVLLDQYLRANPRGALAEDALALSIEAAAARKDPRAAAYAARYLARYPNGRFRAVAERALSR